MKFLLDTHLLLWAVASPELLSRQARSLIDDPQNIPVFSVASIWEVAIKHSRGREEFDVPPALLRSSLLNSGYEELAILGQHAIAVSTLPAIHRDPFDRLLIAQAAIEGITLLTSDTLIAKYPGLIRRV